MCRCRAYAGMSEPTVILGTGPFAARVAAELNAREDGDLLGVIGEAPGVEPEFDAPLLGALPDLQKVLAEYLPERVVVAMQEEYGRLSADRLLEMEARGLTVETGMDAYERLTG